jgi:hypothetical protein
MQYPGRGTLGTQNEGVIDAKTNKLVQKIDIMGGSPHSVAVNESNGHVYLPVGKPNGGCGCIQVYALSK